MTRKILLRACLLAAALVLVSCVPSPYAPEEAPVPFVPPAVYRVWHREVEACLDLAGAFELIRWFLVPNTESHTELGVAGATGVWTRRGIYLLEGLEEDRPTVKHEMAHDVLYRATGDPDVNHSNDLAFKVCDESFETETQESHFVDSSWR
jgi:hypothetical protein